MKAAETTAVKKKMRKILQSKNYIFFYFLKPNEEEQETKQFQMDTAVAEEYIEYYADKYKELTAKHKFAIPLCKHTDESEIYVVRRRGRLAPRQPLSVCALLPAYEENRHLRPLGNLGHRLRRPRWID